jgi:cytochrome c peroxidase
MRGWGKAFISGLLMLAAGLGFASLGLAAKPAGLPAPVPAENPLTAAKAELGRHLFYDPRLSGDGTMSCASCHEQPKGFTDGLAHHIGVTGEAGIRNVPGLANAARRSPLTWADPGILSLEQQALVPITGEHPVEMGLKGREDSLLARLHTDRCYYAMFARAFPGQPIDMRRVVFALASFERTLVSDSSPYDRFLTGDSNAMPPQAVRGAKLFTAIGCSVCHTGPDLTDNRYHYVGTTTDGTGPAYASNGTDDPLDKLRTPPLRNVAVTGPWLHDGSADSVEEAIRRHAPRAIVGVDMPALLAFMNAQTDRAFLTNPSFAAPAQKCGEIVRKDPPA